MKSRRPISDPQAGDIVTYRGWTIEVLEREPTTVGYKATKKGKPTKTGAQPLSVWTSWSGSAKVKQSSSDAAECVATASVSARCEVGGHSIQGMTHCLGLKFYCKDHCPSVHKAKKGAFA